MCYFSLIFAKSDLFAFKKKKIITLLSMALIWLASEIFWNT